MIALFFMQTKQNKATGYYAGTVKAKRAGHIVCEEVCTYSVKRENGKMGVCRGRRIPACYTYTYTHTPTIPPVHTHTHTHRN